jgi:hypothetical protein
MKRHPGGKMTWVAALMLGLLAGACTQTYYNAMEKVGIHKRDILVDRVESARDAQAEAQEQFKSALEQFEAVVGLEETDLKKAYQRLDAEYQDSEAAAREVSERIAKVASVAEDLFDEWEEELGLYQSKELRRRSQQQLDATRRQYQKMLASMQRAEKSMAPVLRIFQDNVLFLKHNLNAQAIGSLKTEFAVLQGKIDGLIKKMNTAINSSNQFIAGLKQ